MKAKIKTKSNPEKPRKMIRKRIKKRTRKNVIKLTFSIERGRGGDDTEKNNNI